MASFHSTTVKKGPYMFRRPKCNFTVPTKQKVSFQRVRKTEDAELTLMHRGYWKSYCYAGDSLDPNNSCDSGFVHDQPSFDEALEWLQKGECRIDSDCTDCYGSDSDAFDVIISR